jgi:hypothetical protein
VKRILRRPSPATVIACIALFASLGGISYGVATGFIDSREIKDDDVRSRDIRNNTLRTRDLRNNDIRGVDIRNSTIRGRDVALDALTGKDIKESKLEKVAAAAVADSAATAANSAALGGKAASAFAPAQAEAVRLVAPAEFQNGFAAAGSDALAPGFWKDPFGTVHLQGSADGDGGTIFTLPTGYRPAGTASFLVATASGSATVEVRADGAVFELGMTPVDNLSLDGITFRSAD